MTATIVPPVEIPTVAGNPNTIGTVAAPGTQVYARLEF